MNFRATPLPTRSSRLGLALALLLLSAGACATPGLPPAEPAGAVADQTLRRTQDLYLYPDRLDRRMLVGALEALEARFDPVRFEPGESSGLLWVGKERAEVPLAEVFDAQEFRSVLGQALAFVELELGDDLDLKDDEDLELLALRGALHALDQYTTIFSGRGTEDFQIRFSGKLSGIGSRIGLRDGKLVSVRVFPDSPAQRGGLQDGDAILEIDGEPTRPLSVSEAVGRIRGPEGTLVLLTILRGEETLPIEITRGRVVVPSVEVEELEDGFGYARIFQVSRSTPDEFRERVEGLGELRGLVLDLRGNTGGSMLAAATLADMFVAKGTIVRVVAREDRQPRRGQARTVANQVVDFRFPIAILVDGSTASAAEILSGALAPLPHVTVIGQTTFGKGLIQRVVQIPDENLLKLTVAEYLLSEDREIHEKGIEPDILLFPVPADRPARLAKLSDDSIPYLRAPGEDDRFPIEVGTEVLRRGRPEAEVVVRRNANAAIAEHLSEVGISWADPEAGLPDELPEPLDLRGEELQLVMGEPARLAIRVHNPNDFAIPDAWLALQSLTDSLPDHILPLGTIAAHGDTLAEVDVTPPDGIGADSVPVLAHVATGDRTLASQRLLIEVANHVPDIEIEIVRGSDETVDVTLRNRGVRGSGSMRIDTPGATRTIETLGAGEEESFELPLAGPVEHVAVSFLGPRAQRRIEIPLPEERILVAPPDMRIELGRSVGRSRLRIHADAEEGLRQGWIIVDGEKQTYVAWNGESTNGVLELSLPEGDHAIRSKIETGSGISLIDARLLTEE
jgi:carboxyl-terminal processing protease